VKETLPREIAEARINDLYRKHARDILGYALRRTRDPEDAADVVAETFLVAWRRLGEVPLDGEARLWLYGTARHVLANHARGARRRDRLTERLREELRQKLPVVHRTGEGSALLEALAGLGEADRELLMLIGWEELTPAQAARALDATADRLHAPWIVESADLARALLDQQDIAAALRRAASADLALVGIGATSLGSSGLLFNRTYLNEAELREISAQGAVGDICGRLFDAEGLPCAVSAMERVIGLELDAMRRLPLVIGIATGREKHRAIRAALKGGLVRALVTDSEAAREVLGDGRA